MRKTLLLPLLVAIGLTSSCAALFQPPTEPQLPLDIYGNIHSARNVTILLPGIRDRGTDFVQKGFVDTARPLLREFPESALIVADAHWGYYRERIIDKRIAEDIIARYPDKQFTFVGVSLGGFGSLLSALDHPQRVDKLVLLSPFIGEDDYHYLQRIKEQGLVKRPDDEDLDQSLNRVWAFLLNKQRKIPIYLAYGEDDSFAPYYDYLRTQQPGNIKFIRIRGAHDWDTWQTLWKATAPWALTGHE